MLGNDEMMALVGGLLIAIATSFNLYTNGRITGMSGIYYGFVTFDRNSLYWRTIFIFTMIATTILVWDMTRFESFLGFSPVFDRPAELVRNLSKPGYFLAGLLVGVGTKLGGGCTSGHGVCGLPRLSRRSWVYVPVFLFFGILMATYRYHYPFLVDETPFESYDTENYIVIMNSILSFSFLLIGGISLYFAVSLNSGKLMDVIFTSITAALFALGLIISGMNKRSKILGFLTINENWDPSLMIVLCGAVGLNFITFNTIKHTLTGKPLGLPTLTKVDGKMILGGVLFGLGWGLGGLCPGPGFILLPF